MGWVGESRHYSITKLCVEQRSLLLLLKNHFNSHHHSFLIKPRGGAFVLTVLINILWSIRLAGDSVVIKPVLKKQSKANKHSKKTKKKQARDHPKIAWAAPSKELHYNSKLLGKKTPTSLQSTFIAHCWLFKFSRLKKCYMKIRIQYTYKRKLFSNGSMTSRT